MDREGVSFKNSLINTWKGLQLDMEHSDILSEMCEVEHRKKMKRMEADTLPELKRVSQELPMLYHDLVQVVSRFEALLEADAAQQRPLLNSQERGAIKDALKEYLGSQRWSARIRLAWALAICSLMVWGSHWYTKWVWTLRKRSVSGREGDSSELHIWDDDVE